MRAHRTPIAVLVSGGLDSAVLLHRLLTRGHSIRPLYMRCGLSWEAVELYWLKRFLHVVRTPRLAPLVILDLPLASIYGKHWSMTGRQVPGARSADRAVYLPGRNALLLTDAAVAAAQRNISTLAIGTLRSNPFSDASPRFFHLMERTLREALKRPIRILSPLRRLSKTALVRSASRLPLRLTFSCLQPQGRRHCGRCNKCAERQRAFRSAGVFDPTTYVASRFTLHASHSP